MASSLTADLSGAATPLTTPLVEPATSSTEEPLYEIVNGQRLELPPRGAYSTWIASRLHHRLGSFTEEHLLGAAVSEMLFILDREEDLRRRPDVAFVSAQRWPLDRPIPMTGDWDVTPDLAVEVVSPHDTAMALLAKVGEYFACGVRLVWVIYPEERQAYVYGSPTEVRVLTDADELDGGEVLSGFRLALGNLFQALAPTTVDETREGE